MRFKKTLYYTCALCGAGKTYSGVRYAHRLASRGLKVLFVQPIRYLIDKTVEEELLSLPPVRYSVLHSDTISPVIPAIVRHFKETASGGEILFITHEAFLRTPFFHDRFNWTVIWDEFPQVDRFIELNIPDTHELIVPHIEVEPHDARFSVAKSAGRAGQQHLEKIARNERKDDVWELYQGFAHRMLSPHWTNYVLSDQWMNLKSGKGEHRRLSGYSLLQPSMFDDFKKVILLGACFEETLMYQLWSAQGVDFKPFKLPLRYYQHENGTLLRILYATDEPWSKTLRDKRSGDDTRTTVEAVLDKLRAEFGEKPFVWMGNKDLHDGIFNLPNARRLPNSPYGLNEFQSFHLAAILSALNPPPAHFSFMSAQGVDGEAVRTAGYKQAVYQAAMRCSVRNPKDQNPKIVAVMDRDTANWLGALFPGCTIAPLGGEVIGPVRKRPGRPRIHSSSAERKAACRRNRELRLLIEQDIINGEEVVAGSYPDLAAIIRSEMPELAGLADPKEISEADRAGSGGTAFTSLFDTRPLDHIDYQDDDSFIAGLRSLHDRTIFRKEDAGLISPAHFEEGMSQDTSRGLANVRLVRGIWLDNDGGDLTPDDFARLFPFQRVVVWNTYSSTPEVPRWRAFLPTTQAMSVRVHKLILAQIMKAVNAAGYWSQEQLDKNKSIRSQRRHGFDLSKLNAASLFFMPSQARHPEGSFFTDYGVGAPERCPIEPYVWIKKPIVHAEPPPEPPPVIMASPLVGCGGGSKKLAEIRAALARQASTQAARGARDAAIAEWRSTAAIPGQGNTGFFRLGVALWRAGLEEADLRLVLQQEAGMARSPSERRGEISGILRSLRRSQR